MRCQAFENLVGDIARNGLVEAQLKLDALDHASECPSCYLRLENERQVSAGLNALALADTELSAPAALESDLVGMYRSAAVQRTSTTVVEFDSVKRARKFRWAVAAAAAIAAAILAGGAVEGIFKASKTGPNTQVTMGQPISTPSPVPQNSPSEVATLPPSAVTPNKPVKSRRSAKPTVRAIPEVAVNRPTNPEIVAPAEVATDFIPVSYSSSLMPLDSGRIVRVELPRSAMASFGIPMNMSQASGMVKADVVMDEYGSARAIRFVR